jgi:DNA mismatch endonuclease (patch repair protein)
MRSALMGRVRQRSTKAELAVGATLRALGHAYRKNVRVLAGSPDFANRRWNWAIFVNGCFWHRLTGCKRATTPTANRAFWLDKFAANRARDARNVRALRAAGFKVVIVWECESGDAAARLSDVLKPRGPDVRNAIDH